MIHIAYFKSMPKKTQNILYYFNFVLSLMPLPLAHAKNDPEHK
jgi:hypothetical protein